MLKHLEELENRREADRKKTFALEQEVHSLRHICTILADRLSIEMKVAYSDVIADAGKEMKEENRLRNIVHLMADELAAYMGETVPDVLSDFARREQDGRS